MLLKADVSSNGFERGKSLNVLWGMKSYFLLTQDFGLMVLIWEGGCAPSDLLSKKFLKGK